MNSFIRRVLSGDKRSVIVKKNILGSLIIKGCSILISLMLVPLTLGYVSSELYGIWLTLSSIMMWLNFFDVGFTLGLKTKLTEAIALNDWEKGRALVSTTYFMMIIIFIPLCIILINIIPFIDWAKFLNVNPIYNSDILKALYVLILCFCLQMIVNVLTAVIAAFQRVALSSAFPVIGNFLSLIAIYILIQICPPSLWILALAISAMPVIILIIASLILFNKKLKIVKPSIRYIDKKYIHNLFGLGFKFFIIQIQVVVLYQCTNILISNISGAEDVTAYNIAYKYLGVAMMIYTIILTPLWPAFTDAYTKKDFAWMKNIYHKMTILFIASTIILLIMTLISPYIYHLWIGEKAHVPFEMTAVIAIYMIIHSWDTLQIQLINGIGCVKLQSYMMLVGLIIHIPLSLFLGKYTNAIGVVLSMITINIIYASTFTIQIKKIFNQKASGIWEE